MVEWRCCVREGPGVGRSSHVISGQTLPASATCDMGHKCMNERLQFGANLRIQENWDKKKSHSTWSQAFACVRGPGGGGWVGLQQRQKRQ